MKKFKWITYLWVVIWVSLTLYLQKRSIHTLSCSYITEKKTIQTLSKMSCFQWNQRSFKELCIGEKSYQLHWPVFLKLFKTQEEELIILIAFSLMNTKSSAIFFQHNQISKNCMFKVSESPWMAVFNLSSCRR